MNNDIFQSYKKALEYYTNKFIEAHKKEIEKVFNPSNLNHLDYYKALYLEERKRTRILLAKLSAFEKSFYDIVNKYELIEKEEQRKNETEVLKNQISFDDYKGGL